MEASRVMVVSLTEASRVRRDREAARAVEDCGPDAERARDRENTCGRERERERRAARGLQISSALTCVAARRA